MKKFVSFIAVGTFFSSVEEFLTIVVLKHHPATYIFTLLVVYPVFLALVWWTSRLIGRLVERTPAQELTHYFIYGGVGLLIEWFIIGLSPWSDPSANPVVMLIFQLGMFSFWATVAFAPRLFTNADQLSRDTSKAVLKFYVPYFVAVYAISFAVPLRVQFATTIVLIVIGYLALNLFYATYFLRSFALQHEN